MESRGTVTTETYDAGGNLQERDVGTVRQDLRDAPGDWRPMAQRRGAAAHPDG